MVFQELLEVIGDLMDRPRIWTCRTVAKAKLGFPARWPAEAGQSVCCRVGGLCLTLRRDGDPERTACMDPSSVRPGIVSPPGGTEGSAPSGPRRPMSGLFSVPPPWV